MSSGSRRRSGCCGEVRVEKVVAIHDVGRIVNPLGARSQVEGGIIQALGHTFSEARLDDPHTGTVLTKTLDAYKLPTIADVPEIVCELIDKPDAQLTNLGSKGLGEPPIIPTAAAIANAIRDATGADVTSLPRGAGAGSAWLVTAYDFPARRVFTWALLLPLAVAVGVVVFGGTVIAVYAHGPVAVKRMVRTGRLVYRNLVMIYPQSIALCIAIRKQSSL